jgi:flagellar basal-body rod modification protein FlgD
MAIAATSSSNSASAAATQALLDAANGTKTTSKTKMADQQDRFLKLLTTQLKNQDPLNPMDNAQMTSQLAQISTVDGIERLNATLQKMMSSSADGDAMQAVAMVGHNVMVNGNNMQLTDAGAVSGVELDDYADTVTVRVIDSSGLPIRTLQLGDLEGGLHNFTWDGNTDNGAKAANGQYRISVEATRAGEKVTARGLELGTVVGVTRSASGTSIDLGRLGQMAVADIKQIF